MGTGTWGIAAVIPKYLSLRLHRSFYFKSNKIDVKNNFPSKSLVDSIKSTTFALTRTRQASSQCLNRRVVLFLYDEQQNPISETIRPMLPNRMTGSWITLPTDALRIYFNLCIIKYFLNIFSPNNDMKAKVDALLAAYPSIDTTAMGFPRGWESEPLWQLPAI